jgi:glycosyltransferase involved in cell wall biosynthesis
MEKEPVEAYIEKMVATMWVTVNYVLSHPTTESRYYLVQNLETDFYRTDRPERRMAFETYNKSGFIKYITISRWCQKWLQDDFAAKAFYAPNGLDVEAFYPVRRTMEGRIRILIEGDSAVDYKNVDESFAITNKLDKDRFEVWYLSYNGNPKKWYQYDKFIQKVPYAEMPHIYRQCDILLKSSKLESFSYPPLEMMSTGGFAVVAPNDGNAEYLVHGENCLLYKPGDIEDGVRQIMMIAEDAGLRDRLYEGAQKTAAERKWESVEADILELYDM